MSGFLDSILSKAKADKKTIVLPEGNDERTLQAAEKVLSQGIANLIILGDEAEIKASGYNVDGATIVDPKQSSHKEEFTDLLFELRKSKGLTREEAAELVENDVNYFGILMIKSGLADGMVSGACHATIKILSPALRVLKTAPGAPMVSAFFIMVVPNCELGMDGTFLFADPALEIQPTAEKLSDIAGMSAQSFRGLFGKEPNVALLSHSTHGSAHNDDADKVVEATKLAQEKYPEFNIDGELQLDAAIVPSLGASKAPDSPVAGKADCLIFPDLDAGNIGYKLVQRLCGAEAYGPILQGIAAPVNDLSRGCSADDIVGVIGITCVQVQELAK